MRGDWVGATYLNDMIRPEALRSIVDTLVNGHMADHRYLESAERITLTRDMLKPEVRVNGGGYMLGTMLGTFPVRFGRGPTVVHKLREEPAESPAVRIFERIANTSFSDTALTPETRHTFKVREIYLKPIGYTLRSRKKPYLSVDMIARMGEAPGGRLFVMRQELSWVRAIAREEVQWVMNARRRLGRINPETLWRNWQAVEARKEVATA
jgi:hypothetical protein